MNTVEKIGLLKMDFLGLANLTILARAVKNDQGRRAGSSSMSQGTCRSTATQKTYALLRARRLTLRRSSNWNRRRCAAIFPGAEAQQDRRAVRHGRRSTAPARWRTSRAYIRCKHGLDPIQLPRTPDACEPILDETYGVIVYQDQVLLIVQAVAGFSLGQADILRKAMGKKIAEKMRAEREHFREGAVAKGYTAEDADKIFDLIEPFAGYAFNKAHAFCYALLAYQTAYLKANYPVEYYAALMATQADDTDKLVSFIDDARRQKIAVTARPMSSMSGSDFTVETDAIRFGLSAIKNVGRASIDLILAARNDGGRFKGRQPVRFLRARSGKGHGIRSHRWKR